MKNKSLYFYIAVVGLSIASLLFTTNAIPQELPPKQLGVDSAIEYSEQDWKCLADNIYHEARDQGDKGMIAIAYVTINRMMHKNYPDSICEVVYQRARKTCQFSWACTPAKQVRKQEEPYEKAVKIAHTVIHHYHPSPLVFLPISTHFTATQEIPPPSTVL